MRGRGMYFYALKEDFLENIKELEKKFGGLQYIKAGIYKSNNFEIYEKNLNMKKEKMRKESITILY